MTPVTTKRRGPQHADGRRRQGTGRNVAQLPTLFDAAPCGATVRVDAAPDGPAVRVDAAPDGAAVRVDAAPAVRVNPDDRPADELVTVASGETLDRLVVSSWERLTSHADAACLLCGGTMEPRYGAHAAPIGGRCRDCGTTLG
ncbi:MAG: hypothetical protein WAL22_15375 [Solirubrobacteraceae bacterium]